jgi:hypothetical protein
MCVLNLQEIKVRLPVGTLFLKWHGAKAHFNPGADAVFRNPRLLHVVQILVTCYRPLAKTARFNCFKQCFVLAGLHFRFHQIPHTFLYNLAQDALRRGDLFVNQSKMTRLLVGAVLPVACIWATRHESRILRKGVALTPAHADNARKVGIAHPEKVRLLAVDVIPPTNPVLRALGMKLGIVSSQTIGMTLRYGIFIQAKHWGDRRLLVHELAHVAQYERFGGFRRFLFQYLQECINPGYPLGDLELEAKNAEGLWA